MLLLTRRLSLGLLAAAVLAQAAESKVNPPPAWKDLTPTLMKSWTRIPIPSTATLNPDNQWHYDIATHTLICDGDRGHEMLRSDRQYGDFTLHVEWRFTPIPGNPQPRYNSGVFVRSSADGMYFVQGQVGPGPSVWLFADYLVDGKKVRVNLRETMTAQKTLPPGEWNTFEMTAQGTTVTLKENGDAIGTFDKVPVASGYIGLEAEGFRIEFRNVKIREF